MVLTSLESVVLAVGTLHSALGQPHRSLFGSFGLGYPGLLALLLLHVDHDVLRVEICIRRALCPPDLPTCHSSPCRTSGCSCTLPTAGQDRGTCSGLSISIFLLCKPPHNTGEHREFDMLKKNKTFTTICPTRSNI